MPDGFHIGQELVARFGGVRHRIVQVDDEWVYIKPTGNHPLDVSWPVYRGGLLVGYRPLIEGEQSTP
jgi:hypothetical protein